MSKDTDVQDTTDEGRGELRRVGDYGGLSPYEDRGAVKLTADEAVGEELVILEYKSITFTREDEEIKGVAILCQKHGDTVGLLYAITSFSAVLTDQLGRIPLADYPVLGAISTKGAGRNKYYSLD